MIKQRKMQERAEPCRMHRCKCVTKPRWAIPRTLEGTQPLFAVSSVKLHLTASNTYTYIYTPVFKNVAISKHVHHIQYMIMPFLRLHLFFQHQKRHVCISKKKLQVLATPRGWYNVCLSCLCLFSAFIQIYDIYF